MAYSQVSISNLALATLGEDSIRSFDESNKRARMCEVFFTPTKDYLLSKFDWPFARKYAKLQQLQLEEGSYVEGEYVYAIPNDCRTPRRIYPSVKRTTWNVRGQTIITYVEIEGLYYTQQEVQTNNFSDSFVNLLALGMAVRLCPALTQDKKLAATLYQQYKLELSDAWETEANVGNTYRSPDNDPNMDSFITSGELGYTAQNSNYWIIPPVPENT